MEYNFLINQAFARIFVVASSSAIALWSFLIVKNRALSVAIGLYGLLLGPAVIIAMITGGLSLDVHGFGLIIFGPGDLVYRYRHSLIAIKRAAPSLTRAGRRRQGDISPARFTLCRRR